MNQQQLQLASLKVTINTLRSMNTDLRNAFDEQKARGRVQAGVIEAATEIIDTQSRLITKLYLAYNGIDDSVSEEDHETIMAILDHKPEGEWKPSDKYHNMDDLPF